MEKCYKVLCFILISCSSTTFANTDNIYYISANAGVFRADFDNVYRDRTDIIPQNIAQTTTQHGYTGGLSVGVSHHFDQNYFLGAELTGNIDGNYASFQSGASTSAFSDAIQIRYHVDLTAVPGMMLSRTIAAYLKLGLSFAALQDNLSSPVGFTPITTTFNSNKSALGLAAGLGISKSITDHIALFTEANYHDYGSVDFGTFQNFSATYAHSTHVYSYDLVIGAVYKF